MTDSEKLDLLLAGMQEINTRLSSIEDRLSVVEDRLSVVEGGLSALAERVTVVEHDVRQIKLIAENELRVNIKRIAEGHLDLSRNLHEAIKPCAEMEMLTVRVSILESDVRKIKKKMA